MYLTLAIFSDQLNSWPASRIHQQNPMRLNKLGILASASASATLYLDEDLSLGVCWIHRQHV